MKRSAVFAGVIALLLLLFAGLTWQGQRTLDREQAQFFEPKLRLVTLLQLTDLSIWTEARYTRHPSQADFFSPFQDFPAALEHFPAGSILAPPGRP